jgi:hypothetical protein
MPSWTCAGGPPAPSRGTANLGVDIQALKALGMLHFAVPLPLLLLLSLPQEAGEVETWLHADDSCLFSFQAGAFLTHLQPHAAATAARGRGSSTGQAAAAAAAAGDWCSPHSPNYGKTAQAGPAAQSSSTALLARCAAELSGQEGLVDGCVDASEVSRVYPASTLPGDLLVPGLGQDGARSGVMLPLGRIATEALRFRWV